MNQQNYISIQCLTNILIRKLDDQGSYEILENYKKSFDIPKIPTSTYSSKTFSSLFFSLNNIKLGEEELLLVKRFDYLIIFYFLKSRSIFGVLQSIQIKFN